MKIGIVANGPRSLLPALSHYDKKIDIWIGADGGALYIMNQQLTLHHAIGDFDSITKVEKASIQDYAQDVTMHPIEKDKTDLELAVDKALEYEPEEIYFFGVTGGRMDHVLVNIQLLLPLLNQGVRGYVIDLYNEIQLFYPGTHNVIKNKMYPNISFVAATFTVTGLTLNGFYYPLQSATLHIGSSLCISNKLFKDNGTFSFRNGILLLIKSRDL